MFMLGSIGIVAFRGTDATLVGWKEDFNMSFSGAVPSQTEAVGFINGIDGGVLSLYLCGHSKGGNLALYSASMCRSDKRRLIKGVYSFDAPGLDDGAASGEGYKELKGRIHSYLPESSIIGLLLDYHDDYFVIESDGVGIFQHNPYKWHVKGSHFVSAEGMTRSSRFTERTLHDFLADCSDEERRTIVDTLYSILAASKAVRLRDLPRGLAANAPAVLSAYKDVPPAARAVIRRSLSALASAGFGNIGVLFGGKKDDDVDSTDNSGLSM